MESTSPGVFENPGDVSPRDRISEHDRGVGWGWGWRFLEDFSNDSVIQRQHKDLGIFLPSTSSSKFVFVIGMKHDPQPGGEQTLPKERRKVGGENQSSRRACSTTLPAPAEPPARAVRELLGSTAPNVAPQSPRGAG